MNLDKIQINWFDFAVVILLLVGLMRGRKRGMSEEFLASLQWLVLVLVCGFAYEPVGQLLVGMAPFSRLACYVLSYFALAIFVIGMFVFVKRAFGGKLIGSDTFGQGEYYFAMPAGMLRFACIIIAALALLNARYYSPAELKASLAYKNDVYGADFFPGLSSAQKDVFENSMIGPQIRKHLSFLLIKSTAPETKNLTRARERFP